MYCHFNKYVITVLSEEETNLAKLKIQYEGGPSTVSGNSNKKNLLDALKTSEVKNVHYIFY